MVNKSGEELNIMRSHHLLGHPNEVYTREVGKLLGYNVKGNFEICENCALGKAKMTNIAKTTKRANKIGEQLFLDLSTIKNNNPNGSKHWILCVDDYSGMCWSLFVKKKSDMPDKVIYWLQELKNNCNNQDLFHIIRCDNAGENKMLEQLCIKNQMGINFEYTAPQTPQQNGVVERLFATLSGKVRAMMNHAGFTAEMRSYYWAECAETATKLEGLMKGENNQNKHFLFYGKNPIWCQDLQVFGEIGVAAVKVQVILGSKDENRGVTCMMLGCSNNHPRGTYHLINLETKKIFHSRNLTW